MALPLPDEKVHCHRTGFEKRCLDLVVSQKCNRWVGMEGTLRNSTSTDAVTVYDCADNWTLPMLIKLAERISFGLDGVQQATESLRNCVLEAQGYLPQRTIPKLMENGR